MKTISLDSFSGFIRSRRSIRNYHETAVSLDLADRIIEAARWAPSAHNSQPWRFFVIKEAGVKEKLIKEMAARFHQDLIKNGAKEKTAANKANSSIQRLSRAPLIILACVAMSKADPDSLRKEAEHILATQSLAAALQNMLLSASACGLGACWFSAPLFCQDVVRRVIGLPNHYAPQALLTLGYPSVIPEPPLRLSIDEIRTII